ncbi:fructose-specific phosphotransferase system component IIB [Prauserella sediminis]|uniref:Fructose-specific phosphotransferase system component IIB n=1 Tax=Prauserella sediminis TaxID=577680 RepID=A0A839XV89_9PSEU|nr:hypothetical protein [Prauserella sediminis]MBB3665969.1 fructose-specific phosphotransferase system component IIB [Prauserella sediminis]
MLDAITARDIFTTDTVLAQADVQVTRKRRMDDDRDWFIGLANTNRTITIRSLTTTLSSIFSGTTKVSEQAVEALAMLVDKKDASQVTDEIAAEVVAGLAFGEMKSGW